MIAVVQPWPLSIMNTKVTRSSSPSISRMTNSRPSSPISFSMLAFREATRDTTTFFSFPSVSTKLSSFTSNSVAEAFSRRATSALLPRSTRRPAKCLRKARSSLKLAAEAPHPAKRCQS